jgi:SMI1 / KNR4 family (SUKH-1)
MSNIENIFQEFEETISEKYIPFRELYSDGITEGEIMEMCEEFAVTLHGDIVELYKWTNGGIGKTNRRIFLKGYELLPLSEALEKWERLISGYLEENDLPSNYLPAFTDDFGYAKLINFETGAVTSMINEHYDYLHVYYNSLPEMLEDHIDCYKKEIYKIHHNDKTGEVEISFG